MKSAIDILNGPYKVIADAVESLPRRLPEIEADETKLAHHIEYRLLRTFAICGGCHMYTMDEVAAALHDDFGVPNGGALSCAVIAGQLLADASVRFMPGISPRVSCALSSAVIDVREGLHLWLEGQRENGDRILARGLERLMQVDAQTSKDASLAREVADRALMYIEEDLGDFAQARIVALLCKVGERRREWSHAAEMER